MLRPVPSMHCQTQDNFRQAFGITLSLNVPGMTSRRRVHEQAHQNQASVRRLTWCQSAALLPHVDTGRHWSLQCQLKAGPRH